MFERILLTGGTGSLGQALTTFLLANTDATLCIYSRDEYRQYLMRQKYGEGRLRYFIGDVRDLPRMTLALHGVDLCIHTAALKFVDAGEYNPTEVIATNVTGTQNVITACMINGVTRALFISSDKAVYSIQTYGHSKAIGEKLWTRANGYMPHGTSFSSVRWGNVTGSRGSVLNLWRQQLAAGVRPSLTSDTMSRFWLTLPEAVSHVWWAAQHAERGSILVPHLPAYNVLDLLRAVTDQPPAVIGVRPGEKLAECLATDAELASASLVRQVPTGVPLYYQIPPVNPSWEAAVPWPIHDTYMVQSHTPMTYISDTWPWRLGVPELKALLEKEEADAIR